MSELNEYSEVPREPNFDGGAPPLRPFRMGSSPRLYPRTLAPGQGSVRLEAPQQALNGTEEEVVAEPPSDGLVLAGRVAEVSRLVVEVSGQIESDEPVRPVDHEETPGERRWYTDRIDAKVIAEILSPNPPQRRPYSGQIALSEKPFIHRSPGGTIFQVLSHGIHSHNVKERLAADREEHPELDEVCQRMSVPRVENAAHQSGDSVCLSTFPRFPESATTLQKKVTYLVNPGIRTYGGAPDERSTAGLRGSGIRYQTVEGGYLVGNDEASHNERLVAHAVPPSDILGVAIHDNLSLIGELKLIAGQASQDYSRTLMRPEDAENMMANIRLLADLSRDPGVINDARVLLSRASTLDYNDRRYQLEDLTTRALKGFVGYGVPLNEATLRQAIAEHFNITILKPAAFRMPHYL